MNLIKEYLYLTSPVPSYSIDEETFSNMKSHGWYRDSRGSKKFQILNKRFKINDQWYRCMVRFERSQENETYILNAPVPFVIAEAKTEDEVIFIDQKIHHGRRVKHTLGYIENGVPIDLIDTVIDDLRELIIYKQEDKNE